MFPFIQLFRHQREYVPLSHFGLFYSRSGSCYVFIVRLDPPLLSASRWNGSSLHSRPLPCVSSIAVFAIAACGHREPHVLQGIRVLGFFEIWGFSSEALLEMSFFAICPSSGFSSLPPFFDFPRLCSQPDRQCSTSGAFTARVRAQRSPCLKIWCVYVRICCVCVYACRCGYNQDAAVTFICSVGGSVHTRDRPGSAWSCGEVRSWLRVFPVRVRGWHIG